MGDGDGDAKRSMRPTTARRRPPKVKDATREVTAKEVAPSAKKAIGIMKDGEDDEVRGCMCLILSLSAFLSRLHLSVAGQLYVMYVCMVVHVVCEGGRGHCGGGAPGR